MDESPSLGVVNASSSHRYHDKMEIDSGPAQQRTGSASGHSARQSFFGKPADMPDEEPEASDVMDEILSSSDDDEVDAQQELALLNAKFDRNKRALDSQLSDLTTRPYRATTPLESIARVARISLKDLQRASEHQEMEVDRSPAGTSHLQPPTTHSSESDDSSAVRTPKHPSDAQVVVQSSEDDTERVRRHFRRPSPDVVILPYLNNDSQTLDISAAIAGDGKRQEKVSAAAFDALVEDVGQEEEREHDLANVFAEYLRRWREECDDLDRLREEQERLERRQSQEPGPEPDTPMGPSVNTVLEGRRLHKFNSEYEFEQVLKQSEETARIEQEKLDREAKKNQADMEKEAILPDQETEARFHHGLFVDANRHREPDTLTQVFSYEPPPDNFNEDEQRLFIAAFKETPKKWGEIASLLPGRIYKDCIQHYYANKWDGRFRDNRTKKMKAAGRRGRGGKAPPRGRGSALMADLGRSEELIPAANVSDSGRPKRAAAPTTFGEREIDAKAALLGPSPAKKSGPGSKLDSNGDVGPEKAVKRRKVMGEKPGRKSKAHQPLATLAAAPNMSPGKPFLQNMNGKEDTAKAPSLEDAGLLAGFQAGHHGALPSEAHAMYMHEGFMQPVGASEESRRSKTSGPAQASKSSASSYWSVPEQTDFSKYIAHFGTDYGAIAAHMGTKTQTMIKNHYQRQVDNGNRADLKAAAEEADRRRHNGEDMGAPPTPTPIIKRKYDNPQPNLPRALAPNTDAMEVDDPSPAPRPSAPKHASPSQFPAQPRFTTSAQATPVPAQRVVPSPVTSAAVPVAPQTTVAAPQRPSQHPLGARFSIYPDARPESRAGLAPTASFRMSQDLQSRAQAHQQSRNMPDAAYIRNLKEEQERALQVQESRNQQERVDQLQRQSVFHRGSAHGSPSDTPLTNPLERKRFPEETPPSPPRGAPIQTSAFARPLLGGSFFGQNSSSPFPATFAGRQLSHPSPSKRDEPRPNSVRTTSGAPSAGAAPPPADPPKRSNLLSILNSEPEEPKPLKRESLGSQRAASPGSSNFPNAPNAPPAAPLPAIPTRRETFGQPSMPQSQFSRPSFAQPSQTPVPQPPALKQELPPGGPQSKPDWARHVLQQQVSQSEPSPPTLERDVRPYYPHRAALGSLNQSNRANPSPPPHPLMAHSRTPSLTAQAIQSSRDQRPQLSNQQPTHPAHQHPQLSNPFAQHPSSSSFNPAQPAHGHNHAHHSHNSSVGGGFPGMHHRGLSREDAIRHEQSIMAQREREELERRWRQDSIDAERRAEAQFFAQRQQEQERQQHVFARGPPPPQPLHPPTLAGPSFMPNRLGSLREQSMREAEVTMEEHRRMQDAERRRQDEYMRDREEDHRRRQQDEMFRRQTPLGGGYRPPTGQR